MTNYTVILRYGESSIEADEYRLGDGDLYFYLDDAEDPVAMFPEGSFDGVFKESAGGYEEFD